MFLRVVSFPKISVILSNSLFVVCSWINNGGGQSIGEVFTVTKAAPEIEPTAKASEKEVRVYVPACWVEIT